MTCDFQDYRTTPGSRGDLWCVTWAFKTYCMVRYSYEATGWKSHSREKVERATEEQANLTHQETIISAADDRSL